MSYQESQPSSASPDERKLISIVGASRTFQMGEVAVKALDDVTLDIRAGEFLTIVGPSGSGKTTLLNLIGGLDSPSSGSILYYDRDIARFSTSELTEFRRHAVGFVFQFYNLVPNLTARENIMTATELVDEPMDVDHALELVDMLSRQGHFPSQMSGGEQQRISIARAFAKQPKLLLCDEPTGALDFETGKKVLRTLVDLVRRFGTTVVLITHNSAISRVADRIVRMRSGKITECAENHERVEPEEVVW